MGRIAKIIERNVGCEPALIGGGHTTYGETEAERKILDEIEKIIDCCFTYIFHGRYGLFIKQDELLQKLNTLRGKNGKISKDN